MLQAIVCSGALGVCPSSHKGSISASSSGNEEGVFGT